MRIDATHLLYGIVFPGAVVGAVSVFALFNPSIGTRLLLALVVIGGVTYLVCDNDNFSGQKRARSRSGQRHARKYPDESSREQQTNFQNTTVDMDRGPLTIRALLLGAGVCFFATVVIVIFYLLG